MIVSASCGNWPLTSACSASAVAFAAPQVSRSTIEYDRSTSRQTAADVRRSVSATSKSSVASRMPLPLPSSHPARPHRVGQRADDVQRLLVAELPRPAGPGQLAGLARVVHVVAAAPGRAQVGEHPAQRGLARAAGPPWAVRSSRSPRPVEVALLLELALEPAQLAQVVDGAAAERPADRVLVDVLQAGARVVLAQRRLELVEVGEVLQRAGRVAGAERLLAVHPLPRRASRGPAAGPAAPRPAAPSRGRGPCPPARRPSGRPARRAARATASASSARRRRPGGPASRPAPRGSSGRPGTCRRTSP